MIIKNQIDSTILELKGQLKDKHKLLESLPKLSTDYTNTNQIIIAINQTIIAFEMVLLLQGDIDNIEKKSPKATNKVNNLAHKMCAGCFEKLPIECFKHYPNSVNKQCNDCLSERKAKSSSTAPNASSQVDIRVPLHNTQDVRPLRLFAKLGFVINKDKAGEDGFVRLYIPKGWTVLKMTFNTVHYMLDENNCKRIKYDKYCAQPYVFFIPAVTIELNPPAQIKGLPRGDWPAIISVVRLLDKLVFISDTLNDANKKLAKKTEQNIEWRTMLTAAAEAYAAQNYPQYKNPLAYW